jgi:hypothetical protein
MVYQIYDHFFMVYEIYAVYIYINFKLYTPNNSLLQTILTASRPTILLGSSIVRIEVEGINSKPLKLELRDVLYLPSILINLFSR